MLHENASDHARCHGNKQKVTVIATHPVVPPRWLTQIMATPVRHHVLVAAVIAWHHATTSIPALVVTSIMHDRIVSMRAILTIVVCLLIILTISVLVVIVLTISTLTVIVFPAIVLSTIILSRVIPMMIALVIITLALNVAVAVIGLGCHGRAGEEQSCANRQHQFCLHNVLLHGYRVCALQHDVSVRQPTNRPSGPTWFD